MGSNGGDEVMISESNEAKCSEATVEIKIKTLDSQTYTLRVDKCVPIPALKEQIATVTGVLSEQQRLICRGRVLKDDQLLSAYHVEDGHTLHLVVRQPIPSSFEVSPDHTGADSTSSSSRQSNPAGPSVVVGTFNISEQGDAAFPHLNRILSAVLGSIGITNIGNGNEGADIGEAAPERLSRAPISGSGNSSVQQTDQAASRGQFNTHIGGSLFPNAVPLGPLPHEIPDSLTTLSQYLARIRHEFNTNVRGQSNNSEAAGTLGGGLESDAASHVATGQAGFPTPSSLAEVMLSTRQILTEQAAECLSQLARQLEDQANVSDTSTRANIQANAIRCGVLLQNLGALLLELGRATMTLRMGQTPADALVNAGPSVFISTAGPNPIMVQPLPFQPGTSFGSIPVGTVQPGTGVSGVGSGFLSRNIDIRIRTGPLMPSPTVNQREPTDVQQSPLQSNPAPGGGNPMPETTSGAFGSPFSTRESEVRVVPIRTVVAAVPSSVRRSASDSSRGSVGFYYPVLTRLQRVPSGNVSNLRGSQASNDRPSGGSESRQQPNLDSSVPRDVGQAETNASGSSVDGAQNGQEFSTQIQGGIDQLLRSIFPREQISDINFHGVVTSSAGSTEGTSQAAASGQETAPRVDDEGLFLSNLLHQIMPIISENVASGSGVDSSEGGDIVDRTTQAFSTQAQESSDRGTLSRESDNPPSPPSSKRQRME